MRFENLQQQATFLIQSLTGHEREYALSDRLILVVQFILDPRPPPLFRAAAVSFPGFPGRDSGKALNVIIQAMDASHGFPVPVECMSAGDIFKVAEVRAMVDDWISGKLDELPPSTSTKLTDLRQRMSVEGFLPPAA